MEANEAQMADHHRPANFPTYHTPKSINWNTFNVCQRILLASVKGLLISATDYDSNLRIKGLGEI